MKLETNISIERKAYLFLRVASVAADFRELG